ncbi:pyrroloquinoline quinone biosynthesis protein PqqB [Pseudogemmobacter faecipullorum]|uniref:Coenzyme PQQ synthesis protein B n=1 Tax=Pseudogemmobacter faecipullorum TaxID=2755041 RepID=A0ABS8CIH0_9RHOB|nr:pyrroloquinoline quinone biosynthesis protein PqqB [Pseudogemmobacter faecipullorum]MCB5409197.1 pyrroloquinoline quinone biosynthesis protein PqqB [Pseudogemmobacter faecipullorum]
MHVRILGAAAGGGLPQWNCGCPNCQAARQGVIAPMSQSSVAVSANGSDWVVLNASPDIRDQLMRSGLHPASLRESPLRSVVITNGDVDHIAGLLVLREKSPFTLFATPAIFEVLDQPVFRVLDPDCVRRETIALEAAFSAAPGLEITAFAVPGKVALFLEEGEPDTQLIGEQTVGLEIRANGRRCLYIPGCAALTPEIIARIEGADLLLFDGTVWANDDMARSGTGQKTGARMGHMAMSGENGTITALARSKIAKRLFIHINNTNPVLNPESPEAQALAAAGWGLAADGMEIRL